MIKIEINAETGAEARGALLELLGLTGQTATVSFDQLTEQVAKAHSIPMQIVSDGESTVTEIIEAPKTKRRTKAEIEAEKLAAAEEASEIAEATNQTGGTKEQVIEQNTVDATTVTVDDLKKKAVELGRVGKRELCRAVLQKFDAESISTPDKTPLKPEHYAAVLDEFNKL